MARLLRWSVSPARDRLGRPALVGAAAPVVVRRLGQRPAGATTKELAMLWALIAILLILWLLGFTVANLGAFIHLLLVVALVVLIVQLISGRRVA
jgi:hypothetical protein